MACPLSWAFYKLRTLVYSIGEVLQTRSLPVLPLPQGPIAIHTGYGSQAGQHSLPRAIPLDLSRDGGIFIPLYDQYGVTVGSLVVTLQDGQLLITREVDPLLRPEAMVLVLHPLHIQPSPDTLAKYTIPMDQPIDIHTILDGEKGLTLMLSLGSLSAAPTASSSPRATRSLTTTGQQPKATIVPAPLNVGDLFLTPDQTRLFEANIAFSLDVPVRDVMLKRSLGTLHQSAAPMPSPTPQPSSSSLMMDLRPLEPDALDDMLKSLEDNLRIARENPPQYVAEDFLRLQQQTADWSRMIQSSAQHSRKSLTPSRGSSRKARRVG